MNDVLSPGGIESQSTTDESLDPLASVGFPESPEMLGLKPQLISAMEDKDVLLIRDFLGQYQELAEISIDHFAAASEDPLLSPDLIRNKLQIQLIIAVGLLWQEAGRVNKLGNNLLEALVFSKAYNIDEMTEPVRSTLAELISPPPIQEIIAAFKREFSADSYEELGSLENSTPDRALEEVAEFIIEQDAEEQAYDFFIRMGWAKS